MTLAGIHFMKKTDNWGTPKDIYDALDKEFSFDLDPCPLNPLVDGLEINWNGSIFVNPPYSDVGVWLKKAHEELRKGNSHTIVFLVFARTDTKWFHNFVYGRSEIRFLKGRIKFLFEGKQGNPAPTPSMLVIFRGLH